MNHDTTTDALAVELREHVAAGFPGLYLNTFEPEDAELTIARMCEAEGWQHAAWDLDRGLTIQGRTSDEPVQDPLSALRALQDEIHDDTPLVLVLPNYHRFLGSPEIVQAVTRWLQVGKRTRAHMLILAPLVQLPAELEKSFTVIDHQLPGRDALTEIARGVATEDGELPDGDELVRVIDAAAGLTRMEAENAFALSLVRRGVLEPETVWRTKAQTLRASGLLELHRGGESFDDLGGLESLKSFCLRALRPLPADHPARPRGVMLLGVPGTGKSAFAKALGKQTGRPTVVLDLGRLYGGLVGDTERNVRQALACIDAMAPCIAFIDEVEKALAGGVGGGSNDSGVSQRLFGTLLSWLNDHESDVFTVCTANDVSRLPPEFTRSERFDGVFFVDLPTAEERQAIWRMYLTRYGLDASQAWPSDAGWTGAEIRSCCRLASLLDISLAEAGEQVVPVAVTAAEKVEQLRTWASGRCLSTSVPGLFRADEATAKPAAKTGKRRRKVDRPDAANN